MEQPKSDPQGDLFDVDTDRVDTAPDTDLFDVNTVVVQAAGATTPSDSFDAKAVVLDGAGHELPSDVFDVATVVVDSGSPRDYGIHDVPTIAVDDEGERIRASAGLSAALPQPGTQLGEYLLETKLGTGGQGAVYMGLHLPLGVRHAVKVILMEDQTCMQRFAREARALAALDGHPGIVRVFHCGTAGNWGYIACDLVEGIDLHRAVSKGAFPPHEAARVAAGIARALAHVHASGIVHRDLKPANILLSGPGFEPRVTDFGLAHVETDQRLTVAGKVVGTPTYMAPEQIRGEAIGSPVDIFCLGIVLHEMLTGRKLFNWQTAREAIETMEEPIAPPSDKNPEVSSELDALVMWMLATSAQDRPSAATIALHLSAFCEGGAEAEEAAEAPPRRRPPLMPLISVCVFLLVGLVAFAGLQLHRSQRVAAVQDAPQLQRAARLHEAAQAATDDERLTRVRDLLDSHPDDTEAAAALQALLSEQRHELLLACWVQDPAERVQRMERYLAEHPEDALAASALSTARAELRDTRLASALSSLDPQTRHERLEAILTEFPGHTVALEALNEVTPWSSHETEEAPGRRYRFGLAYHEGRQVAVLFGGAGSDYEPLGATWTWNGEAWTRVETEVEPSPRLGHCMAYDAVRRVVVLFGGQGREDEYRDTWEWDGANWRDRGSEGAPPPRAHAGMAYDVTRQVVVLFGGEDDDGCRNDTWIWHGDHWSELDLQTTPPPRKNHALVYDRAGERLLLAGGTQGDAYLQDVWAWSGGDWTKLPWELPAPTRGHGMVYDRDRKCLLLVGGRGKNRQSRGVTWLREENGWRKQHPYQAPEGLYGHGVVYDVARAEVLLFGGRSVRSRSRRNGTWTYPASKR